MGKFDIMEPKDNCQVSEELDIIVVPTVGISPSGVRLGYGHGFYDKFLEGKNIITISLVLEKQIIKNIPKSDHDINMDWIITEDRMFQTQK
jgi:5-formyltetrahydrofolate cyclo-ligase